VLVEWDLCVRPLSAQPPHLGYVPWIPGFSPPFAETRRI